MKNLPYILFVFLFFSFVSCNTESMVTSSDPKFALDHFFDALSKKDISTAKKFATADSESMLSLLEMGIRMAPDSITKNKIDKSRIKYGDPIITGDNASIPVIDKHSGETTTFLMKKELGTWKVAFDMNTMVQMGSNKMKQKGFSQEKIDTIMNNMKGILDKHPDLQKALSDSIQ